MPDASLAVGSTWNTAADLRESFSELGQKDNTDANNYIYDTDLVTAALSKAQHLMSALIRKHWDVDDSAYFSTATIGTYAPAVKVIHLQWAAGVALLRGLGKGLRGGSAEYAKYLIDDAKEDLLALIEAGALGVGRRSDDPDDTIVHAGSQGVTTPFFTRGDETEQPFTPTSGTRDEEPY